MLSTIDDLNKRKILIENTLFKKTKKTEKCIFMSRADLF